MLSPIIHSLKSALYLCCALWVLNGALWGQDFSVPTDPQKEQWGEEDPNFDFCVQALAARAAQAQNSFLSSFWETVVVFKNRLLSPEYFGQIRTLTDSIQVGKTPAKKHYIISLGQHPLLEQFHSQNPDALTKLSLELERKKDLLDKVLQSKNANECSTLLYNEKFDVALFLAQIRKYNEINLPLQKYYGRLIKKQIQAFISKSPIAFEYIHASDVNVLNQILKSPQTGSVLIVAHASAEGFLVDSLGQIIPVSIFKNTSPHLDLVGVFSCYPEAIEQRYFSENLNSTGTDLKKFHFGIALPQNTEKGLNAGKVPIVGLPYFLAQYQKLLNPVPLQTHSEVQAGAAEASEIPNTCSLKFRNVSVESGSLGIFINREWIGSIHAFYEPQKGLNEWRFSFSCQLLKATENIFFAENISIHGNASLNRPDLIEVDILDSQSRILEITSQKLYFRNLQKFRSLKIFFNFMQPRE